MRKIRPGLYRSVNNRFSAVRGHDGQYSITDAWRMGNEVKRTKTLPQAKAWVKMCMDAQDQIFKI